MIRPWRPKQGGEQRRPELRSNDFTGNICVGCLAGLNLANISWQFLLQIMTSQKRACLPQWWWVVIPVRWWHGVSWWHHLSVESGESGRQWQWRDASQWPIQEGAQTDYGLCILWFVVYFILAKNQAKNPRFYLEGRYLLMRYQTPFLTVDKKIETHLPLCNTRKPTVAVKSLRFLGRTWCIQNIVFLFKYYITSFKGLKVVKIFQLSSSIHGWDETGIL